MKKYFLFIITLLLIIPGCSKLITITIKDSKGNILNTVKVQKGETLNSITAPIKDGYIFTSWTQSGMNISKDTVLNKDISITANYTEKPSLTKTYKIKFIIENEEKYQTINVGEKIKKPTKPRKNKYTFIGWYQGNELYEKRKREKIKLCEENNIPLIQFYQSDIYSKTNKEIYETLLNYIEEILKEAA